MKILVKKTGNDLRVIMPVTAFVRQRAINAFLDELKPEPQVAKVIP